MIWQESTLGVIADTQLGKMLDAKKIEGEFHPYLGNDNVQWDGIDLSEVKEMRFKDSELSKFALKPGDLLVCEGGDPGRCAIWNLEEEMYYQKALHRVRAHEDVLDNRFLYYFLVHICSTQEIRQYYTGGATIKHLPAGALNRVKVRYPDLAMQRRIADVLSAYDELIENNRRQIKLLEEAAQRLYKEWFVDLKFPGHETTPIHNGLPEGWEWKHLHEFADVVMGQSPKSEHYNDEHEGLPFHQGVGSYGKRYVIDGTFCTQPTRIAKAGSVLFSVRAPVGRLNITKNEIIIGRGLAAVNHHDGKQSFLFYLLKERFFEDDLLGNGAIFSSITKQELLALSFLIPNPVTIDRFEKITTKIDEKIKELDNQGNLLAEARDRLLPKLMSGEIEV